MAADERKHPGEAIRDHEAVLRALNRAVREAIRRHKLLGLPLADGRDGKVVWVSPEDVDLGEEQEEALFPPER